MQIEVITKNGEKAKRLYRIDREVWVQLSLQFKNEDDAKDFVGNVGTSYKKIVERLSKNT